GDTVKVEQGNVYVNNALLNERLYLSPDVDTDPGAFMHEGAEYTVPENHFIVLGDNRMASSDSREWGFVPKDKIVGKSMVVYWPPQNFKYVRGVEYSEN